MADIDLKSFPFDSMKVLNEQSQELEDDRLYEAQIFRDYFRKFLSNGVYYGHYKNYGESSMQVVLDTGLTVKVKKGCGIIEGVDYENESDRLITLERPASGSRVDRIVVQMNSSLDTRMTKLIVKQGTGTTPAELTRTDNIYEICIAEVTVKSTSNIADEDIVDKRLDTTLCGIVNSLISVDGEELYEQFQEYVQSVEENMMLKNQDIVDDLVSTDTDKALSAKQGKLLKDSVDNTYNKTEIDNKLSDSGWLSLPINLPFPSQQALITPANIGYRKVGKIVQLDANLKTNTESVGSRIGYSTVIATLPSGYRPSVKISKLDLIGNTGSYRLTIDTNGEITMMSSNAGGYMPFDTNIRINAMYMV